jgi:hypothetical protein
LAANIRHSSENSEFMTPAWLTEWAHYVMGGIDLDPASSVAANRTVRATRIFTKNENGLLQNWCKPDGSPSRVFLNPHGGLIDECGREIFRKSKLRPGCTKSGACGLPPGHKHTGVESSAVFWWHKLVHEFDGKRVQCAIFLGFSLEILQSAQTFDGRQPLDFPCSIPKQRIRFETEDENGVRQQGEQPTHGNVIVLVTRPDPRIDGYTTNSAAEQCSQQLARFTSTFSQIGYVHVPRGF